MTETNPTPTPKRRRRMAREPQSAIATVQAPAPTPDLSTSRPRTRLEQLQALLVRDGGASIAEMVEATGWQQHSVRGAMAGALKKRGLAIASEKIDGVRRYRGEVTV
jgi:Protein of unknown function (DUF3489)